MTRWREAAKRVSTRSPLSSIEKWTTEPMARSPDSPAPPVAYRGGEGGFPRIVAGGMRGAGGKRYFPHPDLIAAVNVALACDMPLLLTGEPGCGKTDFAFAVANQLKDRHSGGADHDLLDCAV